MPVVSPSGATAIQHPISVHTAVATPSILTVLPRKSAGAVASAAIGVESFNVTPAPSLSSSAPVLTTAASTAATTTLSLSLLLFCNVQLSPISSLSPEP